MTPLAAIAAATVASGVWTPGNTVAIATAGLSLVGLIGVALIQWRSRTPTDARDDRSAENATLKGAAEVAMELVDRTKSWAMDLIKAMEKQIDDQKSRITELLVERDELRRRIRELERDAGDRSVSQDAELAAAHAREQELLRQLAEATASVRKLQESLDEAEGYGVDELTLNPQKVQQRASVYAPPEA